MITNTVTPFAWGATGATNTTIRATLSPNGSQTSTADLTAIQNAINSATAAGGGIVRLNAGTFYINGGRIQMRPGVRLQGPARTADNTTAPTAILKAGTSFRTNPEWGGYSMVTVYGGGLSNMTVANVMVDMSEASFTATQIPEGPRLSAYAVEFRDATNVVLDGVFVKNSFTYHLVIADCTTFGVRNCNALSTSIGRWNQLDGIHVLNSVQGDVVDNRVDNGAGGTNGDGDDGLVARTAFGGTPVRDVNYRNNWVRGGRHGAGLQIVPDSGNITNLNIENNRFDGGSTKTGIHIGYYDGATASVSNIVIGGAAAKANTFVDTTIAAVDLTEGPHTNCTVTYNIGVRSGPFLVDSGGGNVNANNTSTTTEGAQPVAGTAARTGSGTHTDSGAPTFSRPVNVTGTTTQSAPGSPSFRWAASAAGSGNTSSNSSTSTTATAGASGTGSSTASGAPRPAAAAASAGIGGTGTSGVATAAVTANRSGAGTTAAIPSAMVSATAPRTGAGTTTTLGEMARQYQAMVTGQGNTSASSRPLIDTAVPDLAGAGNTTWAGRPATGQTTQKTGTGTTVATAAGSGGATAARTGAGSTSTAGAPRITRATATAGSGAPSAAGSPRASGTAGQAGTNTAAVQAAATVTGQAAPAGNGYTTVQATATHPPAGNGDGIPNVRLPADRIHIRFTGEPATTLQPDTIHGRILGHV